MHEISDQNIVFIILAVILLVLIGITFMVIIDHKVKIPGYFQQDPFSISGLRISHLFTSFIILTILLIIISSLVFVLIVTLFDNVDFNSEETGSKILEEFKQQRIKEKKRQFHNIYATSQADLGKKPVCFYCHGNFPHSKERSIRVLLNMHTQFIGCLTCHNNPRKVNQDRLRFSWLNYSGIKVTGPHFGTDVGHEKGFLVKTDDYHSKIVAYKEEGGEYELLEIPETNPKVATFLALRNQLTIGERQSIKRTIHKNVTRKARTCTRCHAREDKSYLPFKQLGFSQQRISDITSAKIIHIVTKYSKATTIPNIFNKQTKQP